MSDPLNLPSGASPDLTSNRIASVPMTADSALGILELSGRVAASYGDALTVINGHAALLLERTDLSPEARSQVMAIGQSGAEAARLTRQLLIISGRHSSQGRTIDLHKLVTDMAPALRHLLGDERVLELRLNAAPAIIWTDAGLFEQVLVSLADNARAALAGPGTLSLCTESVTITEAEAAQQLGGRPGRFICLTVADNGCGMSPEILARLFEPFFSTKEPGKATGRGLAAVLSIVKQSHGWLTVGSQPGAGTTLRIFLPPALDDQPEQSRVERAAPFLDGAETVLLVDDENALRELIALVLKSFGYRVLQASSTAEALEVWKWHAPRIALLFTDLVLPGNLTGLDLALRFQGEKPGLKIICISGNAGHVAAMPTAALAEIRFLQKPCAPSEIARTVRAVLDQSSAEV